MKKITVFSCFLIMIITVQHAHATLINLSLNSDTIATANQVDTFHGNFASNAIDGDPDTLWRATSHGTPTDPKFLIVDLDGIFEVSHIVLTGHDTGYVNYYMDYRLYSSTDGSTFNLLSTGKIIDPPPPPTPNYYDYFNDTVYLPTTLKLMRFAKFEVFGGPQDAHLNEIEIWGESKPVPEPATIILLGTGLIGLAGWGRRKLRK